MHFKKLLSVFLIRAFLLIIVIVGIGRNNFFEIKTAAAATIENVSGYAWSSNIGWISFNCLDKGVCGTSDYKVKYDRNTGNLSGYAWSSNIGWIYFGPDIIGKISASTAPETPKQWAKATSPTNPISSAVSGWARAYRAIPDKNDVNAEDSQTLGGWDGWIKFDHGKDTPVSVNFSTGDFSGYAWGSEVVGWISFNCTNTGTCGTPNNPNYKVSILPEKEPEKIPFPLTVEIYGEKWTDGTIAGGSVTGTGDFSCVGDKTTDSNIAVGADKLLKTCLKNYTQNTNIDIDLYASPAKDCPAPGCGFKKWEGACSGSNCSFTLDADKTVKAYFKVTQGNGDGSSIVNAACGTVISTGWSDAPTANLCSSSGGNTTPVRSGSSWTWTCNGSNGGTNASCSAPYDPGGVNLTLNKTGSGTGNVKLYSWRDVFNDYGETVDNDFQNNETNSLKKDWWFKMTAAPDSGSSFSSWSGCGSTAEGKSWTDVDGIVHYSTPSSGENACYVTMTGDKTATVTFGSGSGLGGGGGGGGGGSSVKAYLSAKQTVVSDGNSTVVTWTSDNADSCEQKEGGSDTGWISASDTASGNYTTANFTTSGGPRTYKVTCANGSQKADAEVTINVGDYMGDPSVSMWADPQTVGYKKTSMIQWLSSNIFPNSCLLFSAVDTMNGYLSYFNFPSKQYFGPGYYNSGIGENNSTGQKTGKLSGNTVYKIQCGGYGPDWTKVTAQTTVTVAKPVSNFTLTNPTGGTLVATIVEGLSANSSSLALTLNGEAIGDVNLSANIPTLSGAKAQFSSDNGAAWSDTLSVDISAIAQVKIKAIKIPGATATGTYNMAVTATDTGTGGKTKKLNVNLQVNKVSSEWGEF